MDKGLGPRQRYVDVVSSQWRGAPLPGCSQTWEVLPDQGGPPAWLSAPEYTLAQDTSVPFDYTSGLLIQPGQANLAVCAAGTCAQNKPLSLGSKELGQAGSEIIQAARAFNVPPHLINYLLSQESQSWLGAAGSSTSASPGQLTDGGANSILMWNPVFFSQFCPSVMDRDVCAKGYSGLGAQTTCFLKNCPG